MIKYENILTAQITRQCKVVVIASVVAMLFFIALFRRTTGNALDKINMSKLKPKHLDFVNLTPNGSLESRLQKEFKMRPIKSRGSTIIVDEMGRVRVPPSYILELMEFRDLEEQYQSYLGSIQATCTKQIHLGDLPDGGYDVCENPAVAPQKPCIGYSFGIRNDFSFDDGLSRYFGCIVHSFDPTNGMSDHQHSANVFFHSMGLWKANEFMKKNWKMRTLDAIKSELGHTKSDISVLKIDIEGGEWDALPEMLQSGSLKGVKQLIMEFHSWLKGPRWNLNHRNKEHYIRDLNILRDLYDEGFRIFYFKRYLNPVCLYKDEFGTHRTGCHEIHFMRV